MTIVACRYSIQQDASDIAHYNDNFSVAKGATDIPYSLAMAEGVLPAESMISHTKFHNIPELPHRNDLYMTPQNSQSPPNACERSGSYIKMNPLRTAVRRLVHLSEPPPLQYKSFSSLRMAADDDNLDLYDEIPGEHLHTSKLSSKEEKGCGDAEHGTDPSSLTEVMLKKQHAVKEEQNDANTFENAQLSWRYQILQHKVNDYCVT